MEVLFFERTQIQGFFCLRLASSLGISKTLKYCELPIPFIYHQGYLYISISLITEFKKS